MLKVDKYSLKGVKLSSPLTLPKEMEEKENISLISQAVHVYRDRAHVGSSKVKTRAEINRTTKKVYRQKGTGGARHGSRRAPIYVGGGVAHGPKLQEKILKLPLKMKRKALNIAITLKAREGEMIAVDGISNIKKTKDAVKLNGFGRKVIVLSEKNKDKAKLIKNLEGTKVAFLKNLNMYDVFFGGKLIFDSSIFERKEIKKK